ncbi:MAG: DNA-methyltransferase [Bacteroidota bacterium]
MEKINLLKGNNIDLLKTLENNSIDSVITDPPYGLSFMNKKWDYDVPSVEFWREVYRVLKPGGHILSFGGTRTYHRMVVNIEDAGFEIRDQIMWIYGSGFPKSLNIGKAIDKLEGNERVLVKEVKNNRGQSTQNAGFSQYGICERNITKGQSEYEGLGTGLKPANEPICLARKPLSEKTIAENVLKHSTGGINIDGCRIGSDSIKINGGGRKYEDGFNGGWNNISSENIINEGRFPANVIFECICDEVIKGEKGEIKKTNRQRTLGDNCYGDFKEQLVDGIDNYNDKGDIHTNPDCPCRLLDEQSGILKSGFGEIDSGNSINNGSKNGMKGKIVSCYSDKGGASRFFYVAKVSKKERNMGLDKNNHPTVKPINLMVYLCRLITPKGGTILDPFMGSGSSGIAALLEGFNFVGMEMDDNYFEIAEARINNYEEYRKLIK